MAASSQAGRRCALPVKKRQAARKVKMKDDMLRPVSLDSHEAQEIQFACKRTCWDVKNFEYQITDIQLVENDVLQSEFLQKQHELSIEGRSPKELIEEFAFLDVTDKTKRSAVCNSGLTTVLSDTANSALGEPSQGVTVWRCPDLCIQKETEGGPKNHVVAMFKIMRGRPRTVVPQSNLGLPPKPAQNFDSHVPCVVFSGADDMTSAMQIYLYELNKVDHKPLTRPRHCCPYAIIFYKNKASQEVTSTKPAKVAKISKPVTSVTKQQPASGRRLIPFGEKMVTYSIAWSGTLTNKDKELGRVDFLAGQGCKVPSLGTKVVRVSSKMSLSSLRDVLPPECLKNVGSAWDKRLRHDSWRYNVLVVRPVQESRDTMARFCAFLRQSNSATVSTLLVSGAPAPVKLFLIPSCKFTEDLGLGACSDHGKMFAILSYKVLPPSSSTHSKQKNKKNSKEKPGMPLTEKQPFTTDYVDNDFVQDDYDVGDQLPSLANSFNTSVFTSVFNLEKPALKQMDQNTLKKTEPKSEDKQGKDSTITDGSQAGSRVTKDPSMQQPFRDISSGVVPNTEGRGRQRNGVLEQSNFADDASVGSRRSAEAPSQVLNAVDNAIPVDPRLARRRQPSSESNTSSIENRTPPMETPQSPDSISMTIPERDFVETESTTSHISSGKQLDTTSQSLQEDKAVEQPEIPLVKKPSNAVTPKNDEDSAVTQTLGVSVKSSNEVKKTSVTPPTQAFLPKKRPVRGVFAHLKNKGPSHSATASLHLDTDLETVDLATTQRPRRVGIPFGSALKITVKNQNVLKENNKDCSTETKVIKKMKTDDTRSDAVVDTQMAESSPTKQATGDNYDNVMMDLDSDTAVHDGEDQEQKEKKDKCEETQQQNSENGATEMEKSETNTHKHSKEEKGENDNTKKAAFDGPGRKKTDAEEAGMLIVPTHHRYNQGDSFYRANLIRNPWLDDNDELMQYRHVVPKGATNISPPRKGVAKEQKDNNSQVEQIQDQGQHQQKMGNNGVESEVNHSHRHKATTSEGHSKEACSGGKLLMPDYLKAAQKVGAEDVTRKDVQETTKNQLDSQQTAAQEKDVKSREQRTHRNSSSSSTFSRSRSKSKSRTVNQTRSRSRSRGRNRTKSRNRRNPITRKRSTSRKSPRRRRSRSRSRQRDRSRSKSKDSPQGARSDGKAIPRARRSGISVPAVGRNVFPGSRMNITSPYRRKRPERRKRSTSSSSSDSGERPRKAYSQLDRCCRSRIRRNRTKRTCRSSDQRSSRDEDSSSCSPERRSKRRRGSRSNRSSESNDQQEGAKSNASHDRQEKKHDTEGQGKSRKAASPEKKCTEKDSRDPNQCSEEKKLMSKEKIDLVERVLFLTTGKMVKFDYADRVHRHLFRLDIESLQQEAKRLAINKGLSEDWLKEEFVCQPGSDEEEDEKPTDKHISTMTRGAIVYEILQLRKELNLTSGYNPNYMFKNIRRKDLIASLEKLRAAKQEILASSAWNMTKASLKVKKEAPKIFTTDTGCGENPVEILLQRKGDAIVKVVKDFVTHNKSMGLPVNMDKEEMTPKQLMGARCDDEHMESALNVFPNDPRYHSDVHMVDMQNNNATSESRSEAPKKKLSIAETVARSLEDSGPGTLQDNAVKVEVVVAMERSPQTQHAPLSDQPVPQPNEAVKLVESSADNCDVPMDTEEGDTENNMHGSRVLKSLSSLVEYATDSSEEIMWDVDTPDELEMTPEIASESEEDSCQEVPLKVEGNCKQLLKQDVESEAEAKWKQSFEQIERSKSENVFQQKIGEERECKIEKLKQLETESKSEDVFNQEVGTECERKEKFNQEVETEVNSEEIFEQRIEPDIQPKIKDVLEEGVIAETEGENIIHPEIKDETGSKSEENLKQVVKEKCYDEESLKKPVPTESKSEENLRQPVPTESKSEENLKQPDQTESKSEENLKQPVQTESKSEENLKQRSQAKVGLNIEEVESESRAKPVVLDREAKDALLEQNKDWVNKILEQATRPPEKVLGSKEDKDALLEKNKEWVDRVLERARRSPEIDSHMYRRYKERMAEQSRDCVRRDMDRADISASMTRRGSSEQISTGKEGGQQSSRWRGNSNKKKEDPMPVKQAWSAPRPISPTPGNLTLQCSDIPAGGVSQATYATGVGEETLRKAPVLVSHREKCLDCSAQPEQTPVKMADQHQGNKPHNANIMAMSGGQDHVPVDPRLRSNAKEFHDVTGSNNREASQGQSGAVGSVGAVRRNLLENELSYRAVGPGKDGGADFSPCDTTSGSGENSPDVSQMPAPQVDCSFLPPTKEEGISPISPTGSDRELYKEKESSPHWFVNTERQPEKSRVGNDSSLVSPAGWYGSAVDNSNCMQGKVPMREQVGLHSCSYPVQKPEWRQKFPWGRSDNYSSPQVKSAVKPGWDSKIKAPVFPRPQKHHSSVGPRQVQNCRPPHVHPVPRMPYPRFQQHSQTRPPHPSPPHRPPPHYSQQQTSPQGLHQHPPMSPCRPPLSSPRRGCSQTPPRPLLNNVSPRPHHGPPTHTGGFMSSGQYSYKDTATEVNNKRTTDSQTPPRPLMNVSPRPHHGPPPHTGGFMSVGQYNQKNTATEVNNNRSDFQQDYGEQCHTPPTYPTQGRGMARGCPRGGGRGQPFPHPARGRAGLSGYPVRGGSVQRGRGGFRGRGFMTGAVQGRGRAQSAW
ncbi:uncharacterized protein LOC144904921 isoform X2 [Branchiostoma floridae x Branchiostoma belcheri]